MYVYFDRFEWFIRVRVSSTYIQIILTNDDDDDDDWFERAIVSHDVKYIQRNLENQTKNQLAIGSKQ